MLEWCCHFFQLPIRPGQAGDRSADTAPDHCDARADAIACTSNVYCSRRSAASANGRLITSHEGRRKPRARRKDQRSRLSWCADHDENDSAELHARRIDSSSLSAAQYEDVNSPLLEHAAVRSVGNQESSGDSKRKATDRLAIASGRISDDWQTLYRRRINHPFRASLAYPTLIPLCVSAH